MTLRLIARPSGILVPRKDFGLQGVGPSDLIFGDDIGYVASLLLGFDGNEPRLLQVDKSLALRVTMAGQTIPGKVAIARTSDGSEASLTNAGDGTGDQFTLYVHDQGEVFNGATWDRRRSISAAVLAAKSGLGGALVSGPGEWSANSAPAAGTAPSASQAAGAAGVRHIGQSVTFTMSSQAALAAVATVTLNIRDGATGAGTILEQYIIDLPAAIVAPFQLVLTDLNLVGTAATAMTAELAAAVAGLRASVTIRGYDAA